MDVKIQLFFFFFLYYIIYQINESINHPAVLLKVSNMIKSLLYTCILNKRYIFLILFYFNILDINLINNII
jgi:hypothetical protein